MSWDKVAKTGTFTDMNGKVYTFDKADLISIAENYNNAQEKVPLVLGHPQTDAPAFGWVDSLRVVGDFLEARYIDVSDKIKSSVANGEYRYKSISLYPDLKRLKHIGLLGAVPPAMTGLGEIHFADNSCTINFAEEIEKLEQYNRMDNNKTGELRMEKEELLKQLAEAQAKIAELTVTVSELKSTTEKLSGDLKSAEEETEKSETNFSAYKKSIELKERTERVNRLIADGKLMPSEKDGVLKLAEALTSSPSFATDNGCSLDEIFWKQFEDRSKSNLLANFSAPADTSKATYSLNDVIEKL